MRRRRPRLFAFARETELAQIRRLGLAPRAHEVMVGLIDAFIEIAGTKEVRAETLAPVVAAATDKNPIVRGTGVQRLVVMCHYFPEAQTALTDVCSDRDPEVRRFAVSNLANAPMPFAFPLIARALRDPQWTVRKAAAQVCTAVASEELLDLVKQRVPEEPDARVQVVLGIASRFQRKVAEEDLATDERWMP